METTLAHLAIAPAPAVPVASKPEAAKRWVGRVLTGLPVVFIGLDGCFKFSNLPEVVEASAKLGFSKSTLPLLGVVELLAVLLICVRRTRPLGAVLASAYLGGAVATHVRLGDPLLTHLLPPIAFALAIWGGLVLTDARVRALSPFRPSAEPSSKL